MKVCVPHWVMMREAVKVRGLWPLVATTAEEHIERVEAEALGIPAKENFDPLMSLHWHFMSEAVRCGGIYLLGTNGNCHNDGQYCPICEFSHFERGFNPQYRIDQCADDIAAYCRGNGLVPRLS